MTKKYKLRATSGFSRLAAVLTAALGLIVLAGWVWDLHSLKSVLRGAVEMKANTAVALLAAGVALFLLGGHFSAFQRRAAQALALAVAVLGLLTFGEYVFGWLLGIDELLFRDTVNAYNVIRGRMSPYSAVAFCAIGLALAALPHTMLRPVTWLGAIFVSLIGAVSFLGYLWNAADLVTDQLLPPVAIHTALAFILLGLGALNSMRNLKVRSAHERIALTRIEGKILIGFIVALLLLFLGGGFTYRAVARFSDAAKWISHSQEVRGVLGDLYGATSDTETAQLNYLLTGNRVWVGDYNRRAALVRKQLQALKLLVTNDSAQQQNVEQLGQRIAQRFEQLARGIELYDWQDPTSAKKLVESGDGSRTMEAIFAITERMEDQEEHLLAEHEGTLTQSGRLTLISLLLTLVVATAIFAVLFAGIRREMVSRRVADRRRIAAEAAVRVREAELSRFKETLDQALDCIFLFQPDTLRFTYANRGAMVQVGYTAAELLNMTPQDLRPGLSEGQFRAMLEPLLKGQAPSVMYETVHRHKDGHHIPVEVLVQLAHSDSQQSQFVKIVRDTTERKQTEQALTAAKELAERANTAKSRFLAIIGHEIRTPLNGLLGMLELLSLSPLDGEQRDTLETARDSGHSLVRIIDDILDHAKIEAGKLEIRPMPVSIAQIIHSVVNNYLAVASAKELLLKPIVDARISPAVLADPLRVSQILGNFVSNAIKFTAEGYVEVRAELIERVRGVDTIRLSVKDTGIGIETEAQSRLFRPFEQASPDTSRLYGGTGLGLTICRRLAELMESSITMESVFHQGTTMSVTLSVPISEAVPVVQRRQGAITIAAPATGEIPLALVVDDHPTNRKLLARQLAALGLRAEVAADGSEALALWKAGGFGLIITDCNMPEMDGYTLARTIRDIESKESRAQRTTIIAWTTAMLPEVVARIYAAGMDDILTKPAELTGLQEVLSSRLSGTDASAARPLAAGKKEIANTHDPIDLAELDKVATNSTDKMLILRDFMAQIRSDLTHLKAAQRKQDLSATARVAHRMKGASAMVGARELAAVCGTIEQAVRVGSIEGASVANGALDRAVERLAAHLSEAIVDKKENLTVADGLVALVVEDHDFQRWTVARMLRSLGAREVLEATDGKQALALIAQATEVGLVVCDLDMPEMDGMELIRHLAQANSTASVIISSAKEPLLLLSVEKMARAYGVRLLGVIEKPVTLDGLEDLITRREELRKLRQPRHTFAAGPGFSLEQILQGLQQKQFEPFFQPKVSLATGQVLGAEVLARWRHPQQGLILPYEFVGQLEDSGKIDELTFLMLKKAAEACCKWREQGLELTVSVNVSLVSLTDPTRADRITQIVRTAGLEPRHMILEITETAAMTDVAPALENLTRLRMRQFGLSIDDYGTGYASMQQLSRIPFTELKIDQGFVTGCAADPSARAIVESSVAMARRLGITSVAEGVETQADWDVIKAAGCDLAQGYFIAKPMDQGSFLGFCVAETAA